MVASFMALVIVTPEGRSVKAVLATASFHSCGRFPRIGS